MNILSGGESIKILGQLATAQQLDGFVILGGNTADDDA
jgi:hypothetical protein